MDIYNIDNVVPLNIEAQKDETIKDRVKRILEEATPAKPKRYYSVRTLAVFIALSFSLGGMVVGTGAYILHLQHEITRLKATNTQHYLNEASGFL